MEKIVNIKTYNQGIYKYRDVVGKVMDRLVRR